MTKQLPSERLYRVSFYDSEGDLIEIFQGRPVAAYAMYRRGRDAGMLTYMTRLSKEATSREHAAGRSTVHMVV